MNETAPESEPKSGKPNHSFFSWRTVRRGLLALAVLATLIALAGLEETWRGKRAWEHFRAECEAKGEHLDSNVLQPAIPDDQNFATSPVWKPLFQYELNPVTKRREWKGRDEVDRPFLALYKTNEPVPRVLPNLGSWRIAKRLNLAEWQSYYRTTNRNGVFEFPIAPNPQTPAQDILLALSRFDTNLTLLRESASRPLSHYPVHYEEGCNALLPHLAKLKAIALFLYVRTAAELAANQPDQAFGDLQLLARTTDSLRGEPLLISHLVALAMLNYEVQSVWDGLSSHQWSDEQLLVLERELAKTDILQDFKTAMRGERASQMTTLENMRLGRLGLPTFDSQEGVNGEMRGIPSVLVPFAGGFFYQNELSIARIETDWIQAANFRAAAQSTNCLTNIITSRTPYNMLAAMLVPSLDKSITKSAQGQNGVDLALAACALERYYLANKCYPKTLAELAPKFIDRLPLDIVNGEPLKYRPTDNGKFVVYSVGWNQTDDGGKVGTQRSKSTDDYRFFADTGDWVWAYEAQLK